MGLALERLGQAEGMNWSMSLREGMNRSRTCSSGGCH